MPTHQSTSLPSLTKDDICRLRHSDKKSSHFISQIQRCLCLFAYNFRVAHSCVVRFWQFVSASNNGFNWKFRQTLGKFKNKFAAKQRQQTCERNFSFYSSTTAAQLHSSTVRQFDFQFPVSEKLVKCGRAFKCYVYAALSAALHWLVLSCTFSSDCGSTKKKKKSEETRAADRQVPRPILVFTLPPTPSVCFCHECVCLSFSQHANYDKIEESGSPNQNRIESSRVDWLSQCHCGNCQ